LGGSGPVAAAAADVAAGWAAVAATMTASTFLMLAARSARSALAWGLFLDGAICLALPFTAVAAAVGADTLAGDPVRSAYGFVAGETGTELATFAELSSGACFITLALWARPRARNRA
jgi:hypothetical protein